MCDSRQRRGRKCFLVKIGLRQRFVVSPCLSNICVDEVVREVNAMARKQGAGLMYGDEIKWEVSQILLADVIALVADSKDKQQNLVTEFGRVCDRRKLDVNVVKSKVMRCCRSRKCLYFSEW